MSAPTVHHTPYSLPSRLSGVTTSASSTSVASDHMPVPAPLFNHPLLHTVHKPGHCSDSNTTTELPRFQSVFGYVAHSLPQHPAPAVPHQGLLDTWPSWERSRPWEAFDNRKEEASDRLTRFREDCERKGFCDGLIAAVDVPISKGELAEASHPPGPTSQGARLSRMVLWAYDSGGLQASNPHVADNQPQPSHRPFNDWSGGYMQVGNEVESDVDNSEALNMWDGDRHIVSRPMPSAIRHEYRDQYSGQIVFSIACEEDSPRSPLDFTPDCCKAAPRIVEHITPFAEFVDRAVVDPQTQMISGAAMDSPITSNVQDDNQTVASEPAMGPEAIRAYRQWAEPLSDWLAEYVWKVCTTGLSLSPSYVGTG